MNEKSGDIQGHQKYSRNCISSEIGKETQYLLIKKAYIRHLVFPGIDFVPSIIVQQQTRHWIVLGEGRFFGQRLSPRLHIDMHPSRP